MFALTQALALYATYTAQVRECAREIAQHFPAIRPVWPDALPPVDGADKRRSHGKNVPLYEARTMRYQLAGVALVAIPGRHASTVPTLLAEIGLDLRKWPNAKAFCAWLG